MGMLDRWRAPKSKQEVAMPTLQPLSQHREGTNADIGLTSDNEIIRDRLGTPEDIGLTSDEKLPPTPEKLERLMLDEVNIAFDNFTEKMRLEFDALDGGITLETDGVALVDELGDDLRAIAKKCNVYIDPQKHRELFYQDGFGYGNEPVKAPQKEVAVFLQAIRERIKQFVKSDVYENPENGHLKGSALVNVGKYTTEHTIERNIDSLEWSLTKRLMSKIYGDQADQ